MDINTKTEITKTHTATVTLDGLKAVAIAAAKNQLGLVGNDAERIVSAEATTSQTGLVVTIVERAGDAPVVDAVDDAAPVAKPAAPSFAPGFVKAA